MAEALSQFVSRRRPDWQQLEHLLQQTQRREVHLGDLRQLDTLYRRASADLAHAQAFFPATDVHRFLNQLCGQAYGSIYQPPPERWARIREFFARQFPRALRRERAFVAASGLLFVLGIVLGSLVVWVEPRGAELLVPLGVRQAVAAQKMWTDGLLSVMPPGVAASAILTNNLTVTVSAFALGLSWGVGTIFLMINNGVHLGAIAALCVKEQMGWKLLDFIAAHGPVELSIIVITGGAGLMLGHAMVDPGELPRWQMIRQRAREAVKLVVGCAPFLALIGVVEGYVSPGDFFPTAAKLGLGGASGIAFWLYLFAAGRES